MKKYIFFFVLAINVLTAYGQETKYLKLNRQEIEALFLKNNLELIAEKFNIDIADAAIIQAKLWDNPSISIGDVNLWSTSSQKEEINEVATSSFAKNTEFSVELSQLIQTANKRSKLIKREKLSKEIAIQEFEEVLRGLKTELRKSIYEIQYLTSYQNILLNQHKSIDQLIDSYKKQVQQGNIAKSELLRLQSSVIELDNEINEVKIELNENEKNLKALLSIDPFTKVEIVEELANNRNPESIVLLDLFQLADQSRPDMKQHKLQTQYHQKSLEYEKALRVPDITLSASYDRYGGVWKDFVGFGISIDLPFFNRNQGGIKAAKISIDQSKYLVEHQRNVIQHEIAAAYHNYINTFNFYKKIEDDALLPELNKMLEVYTKNLVNRNISMMEYIDFVDAYKSNMQTVLAADKNTNIQFEELQYSVGTDIK